MAKQDNTSPTNESVTDEGKKPEGSEQQTKVEAELSGKEGQESKASSDSELDFESKGEFINALGEKNKKLEQKDEKLTELQKQLKQYKAKERQKKLADMSEVEKLKYENQQLLQEKYATKVKDFTKQQLEKHGLQDDPIADLISDEPWLAPTIKSQLGEEPTWEEVQQVVEENLPTYLESLSKQQAKGGTKGDDEAASEDDDESTGPDMKQTKDAERPAQKTSKRIWTAKEIQEMSPNEYKKNRAQIMKAYAEGRVNP